MNSPIIEKIKGFLLRLLGAFWLLGLSLAGIAHTLWIKLRRRWF